MHSLGLGNSEAAAHVAADLQCWFTVKPVKHRWWSRPKSEGEFTVQPILNNIKIANWQIKVGRISSIRQTKVLSFMVLYFIIRELLGIPTYIVKCC